MWNVYKLLYLSDPEWTILINIPRISISYLILHVQQDLWQELIFESLEALWDLYHIVISLKIIFINIPLISYPLVLLVVVFNGAGSLLWQFLQIVRVKMLHQGLRRDVGMILVADVRGWWIVLFTCLFGRVPWVFHVYIYIYKVYVNTHCTYTHHWVLQGHAHTHTHGHN